MTIHVHRTLRMVSTIFLFVSACQNAANTPIVTKVSATDTPVVTATSSPIPIPTAIIPPTLGPTPDIPTPTFKGFNRVEILPDNFFIAYQAPPGNIYKSLSHAGSGGDMDEECSHTPLIHVSPRSRFYGIGGPGVLELCHFPLQEDVLLTLTQPSGKSTTLTVQNNEKKTEFCLPGEAVVENGKYELTGKSLWAEASFSFVLKSPQAISLFFPETNVGSAPFQSFCQGVMNSGAPTAVYFRGLQPNETKQFLLYRGSGGGKWEYLTTWTITADENGNVVEYILQPEIGATTRGIFFKIIEFDPNIDLEQMPFMYVGSEGLNFSVLNSQVPTPTPQFWVDPAIPVEAKWIQVPAGSFLMGAAQSDPLAEPSEKPQHYVSPEEYWIQNIEVTNANYSMCVESGKCSPPQSNSSQTRTEYYRNPKYANYPVIHVNYEQAKQYCESIGAKLPTEAEWEKAARASFPNNALYPWESWAGRPNEDIANFDNIWHDTLSVYWGYYSGDGLHPRNMAGNVWEWVEDWYLAYPGTDLKADKNYGEKFRVLRGGSFGSDAKFLRISNRFFKDPQEASDSVGFRCVRTTAP